MSWTLAHNDMSYNVPPYVIYDTRTLLRKLRLLHTQPHFDPDSPSVTHALGYTGLRTKSGVISVETRVAIALRFCAGGSYLDLQDVHGVSKTSCYSCFHQVVDAIIECSSKIGPMKFPTTGEELKKLAAEFEVRLLVGGGDGRGKSGLGGGGGG